MTRRRLPAAVIPLRQPACDALELPRDRVERLLWRFTALGVGLRLLHYLLRAPLFTDEAKLATSLLDRDYAGLLQPLAFDQIATFSFMCLQKTAVLIFGVSELSLRLFPLLAAVAGVLLMRHLARRLLDGVPLLLAVALFAVSYYPLRHAAELKPYATDLLAALALTVVAVEWLRAPTRSSHLWWLALLGPVAVALSYPAVFTAGGILAALAIPVWRQRRWSARLALGLGGLLVLGTFAANYFPVASAQARSRPETMPWVDGFPPQGDLPGTLAWAVRAHTGRTFGYPLGGDHGHSVLTFIAFACGAVLLWRARRRALLALLLFPFALGFSAAVFQRYPYGGSGRVSQYLVPAICLLTGLGAARLSAIARRPARRRRVQAGLLGFLTVFGLLLGTAAVLRPYRDRPDLLGRDFARWFWDVQARDAELVDGWEDLHLEFARPDAKIWYPGGAGFRIYRRIYSSRNATGEPPDLTRVSREHPLRVVFLTSAVRSQPQALEAWLEEMASSFERTAHEHYRPGPFREQHGDEETIEVYTFVPRRDPPP